MQAAMPLAGPRLCQDAVGPDQPGMVRQPSFKGLLQRPKCGEPARNRVSTLYVNLQRATGASAVQFAKGHLSSQGERVRAPTLIAKSLRAQTF
jgi:hypothetical protein